MASLLGNLVYAGQQTILTTQASLGAINAAANLYSINSGITASAGAHAAHFQPGFLAQTPGAGLGGGIGFGAATLQVLLFTRTGATTVWYNPNTTAAPGDMVVQFFHSRIA